MKWRVLYEGEHPYASGRTLVSHCGRYLIVKEFYADGPSLYTYVVYMGERTWVGEGNTLRGAKKAAEAVEAERLFHERIED